MFSVGGTPEQDFLLHYLLSVCWHISAHPSLFLQKKRKKKGKDESPGTQCQANGPARWERWHWSSSDFHGAASIPQALLTVHKSNWHPKGQVTAQAGRKTSKVFSKRNPSGVSIEGSGAAWGSLANSSMRRGDKWRPMILLNRTLFDDICD